MLKSREAEAAGIRRPLMALIKTRPTVRLLLPRTLVAGQVGEFVVALQCERPVSVDAVSMTLFGEVVWFTTSQQGRHRHSSRFLDHRVALLSDATELAAGELQLRTSLSLSHELPGSRQGDRLHVEYGVNVHVDIPWWPDKRVDFAVRVASARRPVQDEGAMVFVSRPGGPPPKGPYLELSLGQRSIVSNGTMRLSAALGNVDRNRYRKLHVDLIAQEQFPQGFGGGIGQTPNDQIVSRWSIALDEHPGELQPILFNLELPGSLGPGFELHRCKLRWLLQIHADVAWGIDPKLRVPIQVQAQALTDEAMFAAPLAVGSERLRLIWSNVAQTSGLEFIEDRLRGVVSGVAIDLQRGHDDAGRPRILGLLEFPELGVGLHPHRERRALLGAIETGLVTRDAAQTERIHELLGERLSNANYELIAADDRSLRFALDSVGLELEPLRDFAMWLVELAPLLAAVPDSMPIPAIMAEHGPAWERAAKGLGARLRRSDLCLELTRDELRLVLACDFNADGQLRATRLELDPPCMIPTRHHLIWTGDTALPEHELPLAQLVGPPQQWGPPGSGSQRVALHIEAHRVRVLLPAPLPDPALERDRVEALFAFGRLLRGDQGPYR